jgi:serine protease DegQ
MSAMIAGMQANTLLSWSNQLADLVDAVSASVVQVQARRRPASGVVYATDIVLTTARALGREDGIRVRTGDGRNVDAELGGWDPATGLVVLRANGLGAPVIRPSTTAVRVGHIGLAVARSWSNAITASAGLVSVIGGPHPTWGGRRIDRIIRTTAPMHDGFAGGAFIDAEGGLAGIATASAIRGLGVIIPADIAWKTAATLVEHGTLKRGYLGIAGQSVAVSNKDAQGDTRRALLIVGVSDDSPAAAAGLVIGDVVLAFDGHDIGSAVDLLELLQGDRVGRAVPLKILRGGSPLDLTVTVGEK